jgi:hypothetical protein
MRIAQRRAAVRNAHAAIRCTEEKAGDPMFLPILIFVLTLAPVLIPAVVSAFHFVANRRREPRRSRDVVSRDIKPGPALSARTSTTAPIRLTIQSIGREPRSTATQPA